MNSTRFDKYLVRYQKFSLLPLIVSLASCFASIVYNFTSGHGAFLMFYFLTYCHFDLALFFCLSIFTVIIGAISTLYSAKGKIWYLFGFSFLYLADMASIFFTPFEGNENNYVSSLLIHILVLVLLAAAIAFYFIAKKELIKEKRN